MLLILSIFNQSINGLTLLVRFGVSPAINFNESILFKSDIFQKSTGCTAQLVSSVWETRVKNPSILFPPTILIETPQANVSLCQDIEIIIYKQYVDGLRGLFNITWTLTSNNGNSNLTSILTQATTASSKSLRIGRLVLEEYHSYTFQIQFKNFIGVLGAQTFQINTDTYSGI